MARRIFGKIQVEGGITPGTKMRVLAWDADIDEDDHMGVANVEADGSYSLEYADANWDWLPAKAVSRWRPDIYVVVEWFDDRNEAWQQVAKSKVYSDQDVRDDREINLSVALPHTNTSTIYGWVNNKEGRSLEGFTVTAWDEKPGVAGAPASPDLQADPGEREPADYLGSAVTDDNGHYRIRFAASRFALTLDRLMREGIDAYRRPDIFIKVHRRDGPGILYRSPTRQNIISITGCRIDAKVNESRT
jgi:hypothetical protein